ncbi:CDP-diacylglycerol--serine O-phosphatidyltransferase [bacterium]|nr:CDP-diacylglycerol--serine O-phosphatidyltransferase [bacterium]
MKNNLKNKMKDKVKGKIHILPNLVTACNLVMGVNAIMLSLSALAANDLSPKRLTKAAMCVFLGMIFDVFDGFVARLTKTSSRFGMELDSLADLVTFGVAPAVLMYVFVLQGIPDPVKKLAIPCCMVYACCAALRLARFNAQIEDEGKTFSGIPTPEAAGVIISYLLLISHGYLDPDANYVLSLAHNFLTPFAMVGLGLLMVATVRFPAPAKQIVWQRHPFVYLVLIVFLLVALLYRPGLVLPFIFVGYLVYGLLQAARRALFPPKQKENEPDSREE